MLIFIYKKKKNNSSPQLKASSLERTYSNDHVSFKGFSTSKALKKIDKGLDYLVTSSTERSEQAAREAKALRHIKESRTNSWNAVDRQVASQSFQRAKTIDFDGYTNRWKRS